MVIYIAGGLRGGFGSKPIESAYKITLNTSNDWKLETYNFIDITDLPSPLAHAFYENCDGRMIIGGGQGTNELFDSVFEFDDGKWIELNSKLLQKRKSAASCHVMDRLIVAGGKNAIDRLDSIEILENIGKKDSSATWKRCLTDLPSKLDGHTLSPCVLNGIEKLGMQFFKFLEKFPFSTFFYLQVLCFV